MATDNAHTEIVDLDEGNLDYVAAKTGRSPQELEQMLMEARAQNKIQRFKIWVYEKKVGEE